MSTSSILLILQKVRTHVRSNALENETRCRQIIQFDTINQELLFKHDDTLNQHEKELSEHSQEIKKQNKALLEMNLELKNQLRFQIKNYLFSRTSNFDLHKLILTST